MKDRRDRRHTFLSPEVKAPMTYDTPEAMKYLDGRVGYYAWRCPAGHASFNVADNVAKVVRPGCAECIWMVENRTKGDVRYK